MPQASCRVNLPYWPAVYHYREWWHDCLIASCFSRLGAQIVREEERNNRCNLLIALGAGALTAPLVLRKLGGYAPNKYRPGCAFTVLFIVWAALTMATAIAAEYPARPIRMIVPQAPGGGPDVIARLLATELSKQMGQQIVIDNRPGAAGSIGTEMIVRAAPDGYTIGIGNTPTLAINPSVLARLPYDPTKDLQRKKPRNGRMSSSARARWSINGACCTLKEVAFERDALQTELLPIALCRSDSDASSVLWHPVGHEDRKHRAGVCHYVPPIGTALPFIKAGIRPQ
jgi:Tripartite tricarboxylate transporter family receptor